MNFYLGLFGKSKFTVIVYHRISDNFSDSVTVSVEKFKRQVQIIKKKYNFLSMQKFLSNPKLPRFKTSVMITFDDGYRDNFAAAKYLSEQNLTATFFVSTRIVGTDNPFPHDIKKLGKKVESLSWAEIFEMAQLGHSIGSHTATHPNLSMLSESEAIQQIRFGQEDLRKKLGNYAATELFAYPHGRAEDLPQTVRHMLPQLGIKYCFSAYGGVNYLNFDAYDIRRQGIDQGFSDLAFKAALEGWRVRIPKRI